jgi:hypothetical protein
MDKMEGLSGELLQKRLKKLNQTLKEQHSLKKADRDDREIAYTKKAITRINDWLQGKETTEAAPVEKPFTKKEFKEHLRAIGFDTSKPGAVIEIDTKKQIDQMWPWLHTANIQVKMPYHLVPYFKEKMNKETDRPYKSITKQ